MPFPHYTQPDTSDCGPTCLRIVSSYYSYVISRAKISSVLNVDRQGTSLDFMASTAEKIGFRTLGVKINFVKLSIESPFPCILHWNQNHFVVLYKVKGNKVYISDPAHGLLTYSKEEFLKHWIGVGATETTEEGIALLLEPTPSFYAQKDENKAKDRSGLLFLSSYFFRYKRLFVQLFIGLLAGSLLQLIFPFLTQAVVDVGIQNQDLNFVYLILFAQLFFFFGRTAMELIRGWILLHISSRINISLISDFFVKLMKLPIAYFDSKVTGDIVQRISDHQRIENLLTNTTLNTLFSFVNLLIFGGVLAWYDVTIFLLFIAGSLLYVIWVAIFLKRRADLDYKRFREMSTNQSKVMELILGMQEIKMHNAERQKRWGWENIQTKLFKVNIKSLALEQTQTIGSSLINELKNIFISILTAKLVIEGQLTLGMMLSVSYITGQLNSPINQLVSFMHSLQDAKLSLERLSEIHLRENEEKEDEEYTTEIEPTEGITVEKLKFSYSGNAVEILKDINIVIPPKKITAIVGTSGSGKTTLMKVLLKFYDPQNGVIKVGRVDMKTIAPSAWRDKCGVVMQEGYIFNDTIAGNIAVGQESVDKNKLTQACIVANIKEFIEDLPLGYNTKIGTEGLGLSTGQKQRILIARSVYKNPDYLFFDEATSALDTNNEKIIMQNLEQFFQGKTVVIIAHRLSTVKNADQIIVLDKGEIVEVDTHQNLVNKRGMYFNLVRNQLELN